MQTDRSGSYVLQWAMSFLSDVTSSGRPCPLVVVEEIQFLTQSVRTFLHYEHEMSNTILCVVRWLAIDVVLLE